MRRILTALLSLAFLSGTHLGAQVAYRVIVPGHLVQFPRSAWKPLPNSESFADNFEAAHKLSGEAFPQVVTVFKLPMSNSDRVGLEVAQGEYVEFFVVHPGEVTMQVRLDHGQFWLLSRQTFQARRDLPVGVGSYRPVLSEEANAKLRVSFEQEVKRTRFQLRSLVADSKR